MFGGKEKNPNRRSVFCLYFFTSPFLNKRFAADSVWIECKRLSCANHDGLPWGLCENCPHRLGCGDTQPPVYGAVRGSYKIFRRWSLAAGSAPVWVGFVDSETSPTSTSLSLLPACERKRRQPASGSCHAFLTSGDVPSGNVSQSKLFLLSRIAVGHGVLSQQQRITNTITMSSTCKASWLRYEL